MLLFFIKGCWIKNPISHLIGHYVAKLSPNIELRIPVVEKHIELLNEIKELESRIGSIDTRLLASAIEFDTNYFVTTDEKIGKEVRNRRCKRLLKIKHLDEI